MNDEKYINQHVSRENHFRVPEGYFDTFATRVMEQLPAEEVVLQPATPAKQTAIMRSLRPLMATAACLVVAFFSITAYLHQSNEEQQVNTAGALQANYDSYIDDAADYVMLDNHEIYDCLFSE
jgi:hypothetical protein